MKSIDMFLDNYNKWDSCLGCASCQNVCVFNAIEMVVDPINGYMPQVINDKCVKCGRCISACPIHDDNSNLDLPVEGYAAIADDTIRMKSSSGGAFSAIAEMILEDGGVVYGVSWNDRLVAVHTRITEEEELEKLRYSKYVQSNTSEIFRKVKRDLCENNTVLFTGTPCQIAGLRKYIEAEKLNDEKLYLVDLVCGDAPSPALWEMYLQERYKDGIPYGYRFRDKVHGWKCISNCAQTSQDSYTNIVEDYYYKAFLENMMFRPVCETCKYRKVKPGDITIGDFWKVGKYRPSINAESGVSAVLVNTEKGHKLLEKTKKNFALLEAVEVEKLMDGGGFRNLADEGTSHFRHWIRKGGETLKSAYEAGRDRRYDIGLVGEWCNHNYGSHLTYHALKKTLEKMGRSVLLIGPPVTWWKHSKNIFGDERFRALPDIEDAAYLSLDEYDYEYLNSRCSMFCVGADTTFNEFQFFDKKKYAGLAWTDSQKGRIIYGGSFGTYDFNASKEKIEYLKYCFNRFDKISFRERAGVELAEKVFDVQSDYVLDPVFLLSDEEWRQHESRPSEIGDKAFGIVFFYEDNGHDSETESFLEKLKEKYNCDFYYVTREDSSKKNAISNVKIEELIWLIDHAEIVLTNSFHVTAMSIIFNKLFYAIHRVAQLPTRIPDILTTCDLKDRMIIDYRYNEVELGNETAIDYERVNRVVQQYINNSKEWLAGAVEAAERKSNSSWDECDYLRRRVDELSTMVTKLTERVNELSENAVIDNVMENKDEVSKDKFMQKYNAVAGMNELMSESLIQKGYKNVAVYGVGIIGKIVVDKLRELSGINVKYLIDRKVKEYKGEKVYQEPCDSDIDVIIVTVLNEDNNMRRCLKSFYREAEVLMVNDWIDELNRKI